MTKEEARSWMRRFNKTFSHQKLPESLIHKLVDKANSHTNVAELKAPQAREEYQIYIPVTKTPDNHAVYFNESMTMHLYIPTIVGSETYTLKDRIRFNSWFWDLQWIITAQEFDEITNREKFIELDKSIIDSMFN